LQSTKALGIYAAALPLGISWSFINLAIITSVLSSIYSEKDAFKSYKMVFQLNLVVILISLVVACVLYILGPYVIEWLYGSAYKEAQELLVVLCFAAMFSSLGTVAARLLIKEESYSYISRKMLVVAVLSFPIAWLCIYFYGAKGAAYSMMLIELLSATVFNYFYKNGLIFKIHFYPVFKQNLH
jgi:O-antigen/teichoic acid export membrane protein